MRAGFGWTALGLTLLFAIAAAVAVFDFDLAFSAFHAALQFSPDEWLFAPGTFMILLLPAEFFAAAGISIALRTVFIWAFIFLAIWLPARFFSSRRRIS